MTKQQTIELLQKQMPSFYSLEQVISIISDIEDPEPKSTTVMPWSVFEKIGDDIQNNVSRKLSTANFDEIIDTDSVEFDLYNGNTIQLYSVDVHYDDISEMVTDIAGNVIKQYVELIKDKTDCTDK